MKSGKKPGKKMRRIYEDKALWPQRDYQDKSA
jgi:hypothetical protein